MTNSPSFTSVAPIAVLATTLAVAAVATQRALGKKVRRASYRCQCGKVAVQWQCRPASYRLMEVSSMMCCCTDCVDSCRAILKLPKDECKFLQPGVSLYLAFDKELTVSRGHEFLATMQLKQNAPNLRIYSTCCRSPMAIKPRHGPVTFLFSTLVKKSSDMTALEDGDDEVVPFPTLSPTVCMYYGENRIKNVEPPEGTKRIAKNFAPLAILSMVGRLLITLPFFKGNGTGFPVGEVSTGLESLS